MAFVRWPCKRCPTFHCSQFTTRLFVPPSMSHQFAKSWPRNSTNKVSKPRFHKRRKCEDCRTTTPTLSVQVRQIRGFNRTSQAIPQRRRLGSGTDTGFPVLQTTNGAISHLCRRPSAAEHRRIAKPMVRRDRSGKQSENHHGVEQFAKNAR